MRYLAAIIILMAMAQSASAGEDVSKTVTSSRPVPLDQSYDKARLILLTRMKRDFIEFVIGGVVVSSSSITMTSVVDQMVSFSLGRVRTDIVVDTREIYHSSGGRIVKITAKFLLAKKDIEGIQKILKQKENELANVQKPREYQSVSQSDDHDWDGKDKAVEAVYVLGGKSNLPEFGGKGFAGIVGLHGRNQELTLDIFFMADGSTSISPDGLSTVSFNASLKYFALDSRYARFAIACGAGIVGMTQYIGDTKHRGSGGQLIAMADFIVFDGTVKAMMRVVAKKTGFDPEEKFAPIFETNKSPASGLFYLFGIEFDL
jgi:hypothetical protein